jgi:DNA-binding response OmpR family regulator
VRRRRLSEHANVIIAISGDHSPAVKERILSSGADFFYTKPLDIVGFREQCFNLLQQ